MARRGEKIAEVVNYEVPEWEPLKRLVEAEIVGSFMWMHELATSSDERIHAFKHVDTRRYVHLGSDGSGFVYMPEHRYLPADPGELLQLALGMPPSPWLPDE